MNIGMVLDAPFPPDPRVSNEATALVKKGFRVFLFCLHYGNQPEQEQWNGIEIRRYKSNKFIYKLSALAYDFPLYHWIMQRKLSHFIKNNTIDILHIHDMRIGKAVVRANASQGLKMVLDLHDNYPEIMQFYPHVSKFPGKYLIRKSRWVKAEARLVAQADKVISVSPPFIDKLKQRFPEQSNKFVLVPNAVRSSFFTHYTKHTSLISRFKKQFVLLYLGDTHIRRGLLTAIDAMPLLYKKIPEIRLVVVGKSTTDAVLQERVALHGINDIVHFEGWQSMEYFPSYIMAANIGICPLERNLQHDVAYANKLFQYMCFGLPLLVSNAKAQEKLVLDHQIGMVHREKDPQDFAEKVMELYHNEQKRKAMGAKAQDLARNQFAWEQTSKELITLYQDFLP